MAPKRIYCDNNATTPLLPEVKIAFQKAQEIYANPSGLYREGRIARESVEKGRHALSEYIGSSASQILFTSSGTEGNNQVIKSVINHRMQTQKKTHVVYSTP